MLVERRPTLGERFSAQPVNNFLIHHSLFYFPGSALNSSAWPTLPPGRSGWWWWPGRSKARPPPPQPPPGGSWSPGSGHYFQIFQIVLVNAGWRKQFSFLVYCISAIVVCCSRNLTATPAGEGIYENFMLLFWKKWEKCLGHTESFSRICPVDWKGCILFLLLVLQSWNFAWSSPHIYGIKLGCYKIGIRK